MTPTRLLRSLRSAALALPLALALAAGCKDSTGPRQAPLVTVEATTFAPSLAIDLSTYTRTSTGLYYRDVTVGGGAAAAVGTGATVKYVLRDPSGVILDQSSTANPTYQVTPGSHTSIAGFEEGVVGMKVGGRRMLLVPPALGYGSSRNYVLVFTVDLVSVP